MGCSVCIRNGSVSIDHGHQAVSNDLWQIQKASLAPFSLPLSLSSSLSLSLSQSLSLIRGHSYIFILSICFFIPLCLSSFTYFPKSVCLCRHMSIIYVGRTVSLCLTCCLPLRVFFICLSLCLFLSVYLFVSLSLPLSFFFSVNHVQRCTLLLLIIPFLPYPYAYLSIPFPFLSPRHPPGSWRL